MADHDGSAREHRSFLLSGAAWQDDLLQNDRSTSLTLSSILLAVGTGVAAIAVSAGQLAVAVPAAGLVVLLAAFGWRVSTGFGKVTAARGRDVEYWHDRLVEAGNGLPPAERTFTMFKLSQKLRRDDSPHMLQHLDLKPLNHDEIEELLGKRWGHTRRFIDESLVRWIQVLRTVLVMGPIAAVAANFLGR
jgi:hypothetical protein